MKKQNNKNIILLFVLIISLFLVVPTLAQAASLYTSIRPGSYQNDSFIVDVFVSSDQAINAVSGSISFPEDKLKIVSVNKEDSIFDFWIKEPSFGKEADRVNFAGIILDKKSSIGDGKIISIVFKTKAKGIANLYFSSGSVLADDGKGTEVLTETESNNIYIKK